MGKNGVAVEKWQRAWLRIGTDWVRGWGGMAKSLVKIRERMGKNDGAGQNLQAEEWGAEE